MPVDRITLFCFQASYTVALAVELFRLVQPRGVTRLVSLGFGTAGLLAHTLFLLAQRPSLASNFGSLLFLAWILAIFYLYGSFHHKRMAWGVFVLPLVLGLCVLAAAYDQPTSEAGAASSGILAQSHESLWRVLHIVLLLLAAVGVCIGFLASVMYLLQAARLKAKVRPGQGFQLLSLERLEEMNRRAVTLAFPLLTAGMLIGLMLLFQSLRTSADAAEGARVTLTWTDPRVLSTVGLWLVFAILLYLRHGRNVRGRQVAFLTIVAFPLLVITLASAHPLGGGGGP
jgi:ABC-type transport system involved in cytochrome c biogenesis permease subunit